MKDRARKKAKITRTGTSTTRARILQRRTICPVGKVREMSETEAVRAAKSAEVLEGESAGSASGGGSRGANSGGLRRYAKRRTSSRTSGYLPRFPASFV